ncbi:hypothetical protein O0I10_004250 [Lichtheimia ornata]|uniref:HOOK N-terminal domain-containing protein n=1 Tax=Lichtheimia ornata TaxID=688661 RepID=A0AAD7Y0M6_9FUNG|nr:uncharacterized protein O0I10_004250 [Lichtheimia ornata]KAJ8660023.1 hypothetical protein O0I10_004250 [Lichtheimia ornata]
MEATLEDAFVAWINTFDGKSSPIDTLVQLADGVVLSEVLIDIDAKWFKQLSNAAREANNRKRNSILSDMNDDSSWVMRLNNQKRIHKLITRYFDEVLGQDPELLPSIDLAAIAKHANPSELLRMCQFIVAIAVQCDNNRVYIDMIQSLSQKSQHALMLSIEEVMNHFNGGDFINPRDSQLSTTTSSATTTRSFDSDMPYRYQLEFDRLLVEKKQYEASYQQLAIEYDSLRDQFDELLQEKKDIEAHLRDMDDQILHTSNNSKADFIMRSEIDRLKQDLERCEEQRLETETLLDSQYASINELKRKITELTAKADEADHLRSELEEYHAAVEHMSTLQATLEKYEREAQDKSDLEEQVKALEAQNTDLLKRCHELEDEYRKVLRFKTVMGSFEDQVQQLAANNRELSDEKARFEEELRKMSETCAYLEQDRDRNVEQVQLLEEQIKEMELGGGTMMEKAINNSDPSIHLGEDEDMDDANNMEENMKKANVTELRLDIQRLKRKIKEMEKGQSTSSGGEQDKDQLEKDLAMVAEERDKLRKELAHIRNGIPDSLLNQTQTIMAFRSRILDLDKECKFLKECTIKLETTVSQGTRSVTKDAATLREYEKEQAKIQDRLNRLEDITKMQLHDINRMLVEANYLHGINSDGSLKDRPALSDDELETIKEQNANLQICVLHLQEEINENQGKIRKVRDMIKLYTQLLEEMTARFNANNGARRSGEPGLLNRTPRTKEEEYDLLKKQIHNVRVQSQKEQQLIVSGWYDLALRNHREMSNPSFRSTPSSWLGRQRKILDSQLRKRLC